MHDDPQLLRRYANEASEEAFTEIVRRHVDFVYAAALRKSGSPSRAEDVTQVVFTDLARKAKPLSQRQEIVGWLHTSVRYAAATLRRSESRREIREQEAQVIQELGADPILDWKGLRPVLDDALGSLGGEEREAILLKYFKGCSFGEVGGFLGLSEEAARKKVVRAVDKLRLLLAKRGITSTAAALELAITAEANVQAPAGLAASVAHSVATANVSLSFATHLLQAVGTGKMAIAAGILLMAGASFFTWQERTALSTIRREIVSERSAASTEEHSRAEWTDRLAASQKDHDEKAKALSQAETSLVDALHKAGVKASDDKIISAMLAFLNNGEFKDLILEFGRRWWGHLYDPYFKSQNLSAASVDSFLHLLVQGKGWAPTITVTDEGNGHGTFTASMDSKDNSVDDDALRKLLGEDGYAAYEDFGKTMFIRMAVVDKLAANLLYTSSPLDASHANQLLKILSDSASADTEGTKSVSDINWDKALARAKGVLDATQIEALGRLSGQLSTSWNDESLF